MSLDELKPGQCATVISIDGDSLFRQRLIAMGVTPGTWVMLRKLAPLGDPMEIRVRNYSLSIRKKDARAISVNLVEGA
ncbi:MAG: ferrous iron transport protein A [Clostridiaceae bacterium]|nr:ferrous iron transport protein A [Clostridiaceae bacterium]